MYVLNNNGSTPFQPSHLLSTLEISTGREECLYLYIGPLFRLSPTIRLGGYIARVNAAAVWRVACPLQESDTTCSFCRQTKREARTAS